MKKFLLSIFISSFIYHLSSIISPAFAQNKCGVNLGPNYQQVGQAASLVKPGGWVVALGSPGNCSGFEGLFGKGLNVVIRAYNGGKAFTQGEALGWVATLGKMDTKGQVVYFMPWNEPNHENEGGGAGAGNQVYQYSQVLKQAFSEAGLLGTKVILLSPMVDKLNQSFIDSSFFTNPGGKGGFYSLFGGSSINEYDLFSAGPCSAGLPEQSNCQYDQIGIPGPFYALETGVAGTCNPPCYEDGNLRQMLDRSWQKWAADGNFKMFAIFSYDPHRSGWDIFSASKTREFYAQNCSPGGVTGASFDQNKFNQWFSQNESKLVSCGGCGYAPSLAACAGVGEGAPVSTLDSRPYVCETLSPVTQTLSCATTPILSNKISYYWNEAGSQCGGQEYITKSWSGSLTVDPTKVYLPFVSKTGEENEQKFLADYLEGTAFYYNKTPLDPASNDYLSKMGVFRKLSPEEIQDNLKRQMVQRALDSLASKEGIDAIHDYKVASGQYQARLSEFANHLKPKKEPSETQEAFNIRLNDWQNSDDGKWSSLWRALPMFSREDKEGSIELRVEPPGSIETSLKKIQVPQLARFFEVSREVQNLLLPSAKNEQSRGPSSISEASGEKGNVLSKKTYLAQAQTGSCPTSNPPVDLCQKKAITGEGDNLCCEVVSGTVHVTDTFSPDRTKPPDCSEATPSACLKEHLSKQGVEVRLSLPLLDEIWKQTTETTTGFFNIFRHQNENVFEDLDASSPISYIGAAAENPQFYFPHLGGIQRAKEWVLKLLNP